MEKKLIRVAHSPDSDDAFMFYPMVKGLVDTYVFKIEHVIRYRELKRRRQKRHLRTFSDIFSRLPLRG
jgi:predicted solute-binding protein